MKPPRFAEKLLSLFADEAVVGDLREANQGTLWYWKEAMLVIAHSALVAMSFVIVLGVIGGLAMINVTTALRSGGWVIIPYAVVPMVAIAYARFARLETFLKRFVVSLSAFMVATTLHYTFIAATSGAAISTTGHVVRMSIAFLVGAIISAWGAAITSPVPAPSRS